MIPYRLLPLTSAMPSEKVGHNLAQAGISAKSRVAGGYSWKKYSAIVGNA